MVEVNWMRLDDRAVAPSYAHPGDGGADLCILEAVNLAPGQRVLVGTGLSLAIPQGMLGLIVPRSGLAHRCGLGMVNSPGVIDSGYRGEVKLNLINHDPNQEIQLTAGDRVAQLLLIDAPSISFVMAQNLGETQRGTGGHGSTGGAAPLVTG